MAEVLEPGTVIKPQMGKEKAIAWALELYGLHAIDVKEFNSYDDRNFFFKVDAAKPVDNAYIASVWQDGYTLKVTNTLDSKDPDFFEAQNGLIMHMAEADLAVPEPVKDKQGRLLSIQELPQDGKTAWEANNENVDAGKKHIVRLLKFIPGKILYDIDPWQPRHFFEAGVFAAKMDSSLRGYHHKAYDTRNCIWFLSSIPQVKNFLNAIGDEGHRNMCRDIIDAFESEVLTVQDQLESGIIHGDFNEQNILVRPIKDKPEEYEVFSVIDFGDSQKNPLVYELGIAIMYMMTQCKIIDPNEAGAHVLAGK